MALDLHPRNSFESWSELWRGRSAPWSLLDIKIIKALDKVCWKVWQKSINPSGRK
ncbi:MAG: hypothetical protein WCS87_01285 [Methylococcaceae bacterium]